MTIRMQSIFSLMLALIIGIALGWATRSSGALRAGLETPAAAPTSDLPPQPFETRQHVWLVSARLYPDRAPEFISAQQIEQGRITPSSQGDSGVALLDARGADLYRVTFQPVFLRGEPLTEVEQIRWIGILPDLPEAEQMMIFTQTGTALYDLTTILDSNSSN